MFIIDKLLCWCGTELLCTLNINSRLISKLIPIHNYVKVLWAQQNFLYINSHTVISLLTIFLRNAEAFWSLYKMIWKLFNLRVRHHQHSMSQLDELFIEKLSSSSNKLPVNRHYQENRRSQHLSGVYSGHLFISESFSLLF